MPVFFSKNTCINTKIPTAALPPVGIFVYIRMNAANMD